VRKSAGNSCKSPLDPDREREILVLAKRRHGHVTQPRVSGKSVGVSAAVELSAEVTARGECERPGITTHRCRSVSRSDIPLQHGVRVTAAARTVLDLAPALPAKQLRRV
jgi:hypothetical protein